MNRATRRQMKREGLVCEHGHVKKTDGTGIPLCPHRCGFENTPCRPALIVGGVGLGRCEPCRAPGAFWYPDVVPVGRYGGIWMCDSCVHPDIPRGRIGAHLELIRAHSVAVGGTA